MEQRGVGLRELTRRCQSQGWGSLRSIQLLLSGELRPTQHAVEHVAQALNVEPEIFAEYRLAQVRFEFDPLALSPDHYAEGLRKALANLRRLEASGYRLGSRPKRALARDVRTQDLAKQAEEAARGPLRKPRHQSKPKRQQGS